LTAVISNDFLDKWHRNYYHFVGTTR